MRSSWVPGRIGSRRSRNLTDLALAPENAAGIEPEIELEDRHDPRRMCLVSRQRGERRKLLRFVVSPAGVLVFDASATLPGRGMWLSARRDVIQEALKRRVFARVASRSLGISAISVADDLADQVEKALRERMTELLGLARRAGQAVGGFEKVREALSRNRCAVLFGAADGSVAERARLLQGREVPVVTVLSAASLGLVFGREAMVHVAIAPGRLASMILDDAERLAGVASTPESGQRGAERMPGSAGSR